ncbi:glycosyltransferase family 61 protein [Pseudomonas sp. KNUC1026]|uniref:glycosyltransferase family 61 protein n=1 Tax=Pseudomonas sp. KNUC1026 TaxID=2893890 RepID=UPI001F44616F|nr:glycosyltransferase family 61 protein [Pseudomonas sp. KNUC1026]UFH48254.1 glycosyltransferase 61 family protein [Pseudomonas sp. KNUC1026]
MLAGFAKKERILIFGAGSGGSNFYKRNRGRYLVMGFVDNNPLRHREIIFGKPIHAPSELGGLTYDKIIIASDYFREIHPQLISLGIPERNIEIFNYQVQPVFNTRQRLLSTLWHHVHEYICRRRGLSQDVVFWFAYKGWQNAVQPIARRTLQWLDKTSEFHVHTFRNALASSVQGPILIDHRVDPTPVTLPAVELHRFSRGRIGTVSRSVELPDGRLVIERVTTATPANADYSVAHVIHHGDNLALVRDGDTQQIDKGLLVNGCSETNYYHWVVEILSQLQFVAELPAQYDDYPILISQYCEKIPSIKALFETFDIERPIVFLNTLIRYEVRDLLMITAPNNMIPNFKNSVSNTADSNFARSESVKYLREHGLSLIEADKAASSPKRVFLARKGFLRRYNQDEVIAVLHEAGFMPVYMEDLDFREQINIIANAEMIVGPTGAAWTNILFAAPGAKALCWMAEEYGQLSCFSNLAGIVGVDMEFITFPSGAQDSRELYYKGYQLDIASIRTWLQQHRALEKRE